MPRESKRKIVNIELTEEAHKAIGHACIDHGMTKREMVARILEWFTEQSKTVRSLIVDQIAQEHQPYMLEIVLRQMLNERKPPANPLPEAIAKALEEAQNDRGTAIARQETSRSRGGSRSK